MDSVKIGPYRVEGKLPNDNYRIALPARMRIHPIFHISLLYPTNNPETTQDEDVTAEYEVEKILDKRVKKGKTEYLIRWKDYGSEDDTWEPTENLHCPDKVQEFNDRRQAKHVHQLKSIRVV
jgi:hypothetical protein